MKSPFLSKTIIVNAVLGVCIALAAFVPALGSVADFIKANALAIGSAWSVLGIVLRMVTKDKIVLVD
jgi:hypothetical protein